MVSVFVLFDSGVYVAKMIQQTRTTAVFAAVVRVYRSISLPPFLSLAAAAVAADSPGDYWECGSSRTSTAVHLLIHRTL